VVLALGTLLLVAWAAWSVRANVAVYVASPNARIEIARLTHPLQAPVSGRITALHATLGRAVAVGDVLVEFDVEPQRLELEQAKTTLAAIGPELVAAREELGAMARAEGDDRMGTSASVAEASARHREAAALAALAVKELERARRLRAEGLMSEADLRRAEAEGEQRAAAAQALGAAVGRVGAVGKADASDRIARRQSLAREIAELEGSQLKAKADIQRLEHEVSRRVLTASVDGELAELAQVTVGSVVKEGDRLGGILPPGQLRAVAELAPTEAFGRVQPGQQARMRLDAFPWTQHGTVPAVVTRVASEVRDGLVRVELSVDESASLVPLRHGLPGTVEIEVERTTPAVLVLRAAGALLDPRRPPAPAAGIPAVTQGAAP
jgi:membrane fusion protein (multidrug efflux system)